MPPRKKAEEPPPPEADASVENAPDPRVLEHKAMVERELAASQLAARLARYQMDAAALVNERATLMDALETTRAKAGATNAKLSEQLRAKNAARASLRKRLAELEAERVAGAAKGEARAAESRAAFEERRRAMVSDVAARESLVAQLDAFEDTREALQSELREKDALLVSARATHEERVRALESETRLAKRAVKEDLERKILETKREMKEATELQLAGTTKRTIAENEQMLGELRYRARESAALEIRRLGYELSARAADETARLSLKEEKNVAERNRTLRDELKRLRARLQAERAAARLEKQASRDAPRDAEPGLGTAGGASEGRPGVSKKTNPNLAPRRRRDEASALAETLARRAATAAAERDEAQAALAALESAPRCDAASARNDVVTFLRACERDLDGTEGLDSGSDELRRRRRRVVTSALEGLRADTSRESGEKMLSAMFPSAS